MIFTKEMMWEAAVEQMGTSSNVIYYENGYRIPYKYGIELSNPEDVEELYKALQEAHWKAVELREKGVV